MMMKRILIAALSLLFAVQATAQTSDFPNPLLKVNSSGKVTVQKGRWGDFVGRGKYTLVVLWNPRGGDYDEAPYVQAVYQQYKDRGLVVLGVPIGDELDLTMSEMTARGITYPQLVDADEEPSGRFDYDSLPYVVLLGPKGEIIAENLREDGIAAAVREHF